MSATRVLSVVVAAAALLALGARAGGATAPVLAYEAPDGIHLVGVDGSGDHLVPGTRAGDQNPAWSPDGTRLAVMAPRVEGGTYGRLVVIDVATGRRAPVPAGPSGVPIVRAQALNWSRDGRSILFDSDAFFDYEWRVYAVHPDGTDLHVLLHDQWAYQPAQSVNGVIAFAGDSDLYVKAPHSRAHALGVAANDGDAWAPSWSPDGSSILYTTDGDSPSLVNEPWGTEIHSITLDGGSDTRLTKNRVWDADATYSPDGSTVAFDTSRFGWHEIELMDTDGTHQRRLTHELHGDACCPVWRP